MCDKNSSCHIFIFPFQWDYIGRKVSPKEHIPYNDRADIRAFDRLYSEVSPLKRSYFKIGQSAKYYNEYVYFHPFARKALYGTEENESVYYYELDAADGVYSINIRTAKFSKTYDLTLDRVSVHVFDTGVGIVSFSLKNTKYTDEEDILRINDFGRRLYPQFLKEDNRLGAKNRFLADSISGHIGSLNFYEDFRQYEESIEHRSAFLSPDHIRQVFGYSPTDQVGDPWCKFVFRDEDERAGTIRISPIMDDRMYFLSYYYNKELSDKIKECKRSRSFRDRIGSLCRGGNQPKYAYEVGSKKDFWSRYMFGDGLDLGIANGDMQLSETQRCTYARWVESGTLIGITRDSSVYLTNRDLIETHFTSMYYQMAILCLVQRASVLRFSGEIANLTEEILGKKKKVGKHIKGLYENYIRFLNQIFFREVTSQIQGIEMYEMFQRNMNIERDVKALDEEMAELFNYLEIDEQGKLNKVANVYLPLALLTGLFGINTFADDGWFKWLFAFGGNGMTWSIGDTFTTVIIAMCLYFPIRYHIKNRK
ncbi:hypothetical protein [Bacteroides heparinolyticus]|uniref:hypothetical protein n=1 Tax=Prevotella heparinolytica TaxID=28113 RepID=UPI0035A19C22